MFNENENSASKTITGFQKFMLGKMRAQESFFFFLKCSFIAMNHLLTKKGKEDMFYNFPDLLDVCIALSILLPNL